MGVFNKKPKIKGVSLSVTAPSDEELRAQAQKEYAANKDEIVKQRKAAKQQPQKPHAEFVRETSERTLADFKAAGVNEYVVRTVGDGRVCDACKKHGGKKYKTKDAVIGKTAPPFCEACRCVMLPIIKGVKSPWG